MSRLAPTPVVLVTGVDPDAMGAATIGLQWDLPGAVAVRHSIDVERGVLERVVSDVTGLLEREEVAIHACVTCAIREDILPTLERLADLGRWDAVVSHLPVGADARQVCRVVELEARRDLRVHAVVAALDGPTLTETLTGDALLVEQGRHSAEDDRRGTAETACGLIEHADVVSVHGALRTLDLALVRALARPGARVTGEAGGTDAPVTSAEVLEGLHDDAAAEAWVAETRDAEVGEPPAGVWQLDLRSERPLHPERLHDRLEELGGGRYRSRGCFWLPTRPESVCGWDGAGGQVSIGRIGSWRPGSHLTRLVLTGLTELTPEGEREAIRQAFEECLLTDRELVHAARFRAGHRDGFEPWLGDIEAVA